MHNNPREISFSLVDYYAISECFQHRPNQRIMNVYFCFYPPDAPVERRSSTTVICRWETTGTLRPRNSCVWIRTLRTDPAAPPPKRARGLTTRPPCAALCPALPTSAARPSPVSSAPSDAERNRQNTSS